MSRRALALVVVSLLVRLPLLGRSLWLDEGYSIASAHYLTAFDSQRPLYFLFLRAWLLVGRSEWWLRLPSVAFGVGAVALTYALAKRFTGERVAVTAALLMSLSSAQVEHSQEVRMYTMAPFLLLAAAWFFANWFARRRWRDLAGYTLLAYAALLTFPLCSLGIAGMSLLAMLELRDDRRGFTAVLAAGLIVLIAWSPFVSIAIAHPEGTNWISPPKLAAPITLHGWAVISDAAFTTGLPGALWVTRGASVLVLGLALIGSASRGAGWRIGAVFYGSLVLLFAISVARRPVWLPRYFMPLLPALFVLVALGLDRIPTVWQRRTVIALLAGAELVLCVATSMPQPHEQWRDAAQYVQARADQGDVVIVAQAWPAGPQRETVWSYYYQAATLYIAGQTAMVLPEIRRAATGRATWVVLRTNAPEVYADRGEGLRRELALVFQMERQTFGSIDVLKLVRPDVKPN
jgi:uncharacterized membrane protein